MIRMAASMVAYFRVNSATTHYLSLSPFHLYHILGKRISRVWFLYFIVNVFILEIEIGLPVAVQSFMDSTLITKRLHISGLTPAITADDISRRLSTFGSVKCVDGIGLLDGLGAPRKFGYITIETTVGKLAKCMWSWFPVKP